MSYITITTRYLRNGVAMPGAGEQAKYALFMPIRR